MENDERYDVTLICVYILTEVGKIMGYNAIIFKMEMAYIIRCNNIGDHIERVLSLHLTQLHWSCDVAMPAIIYYISLV